VSPPGKLGFCASVRTDADWGSNVAMQPLAKRNPGIWQIVFSAADSQYLETPTASIVSTVEFTKCKMISRFVNHEIENQPISCGDFG